MIAAPQPVLTVAAMRAAEAACGVSEWELMQRAGKGAAEWVWRTAAGRAVTVLCGPGNNGGDGYVLAEVLRARGLDVVAVAPLPPTTSLGIEAKTAFSGSVRTSLRGRQGAVFVDALFGFGLDREIGGELARLIEEAHASHSYCIAIDIPSGVDCDTGEWFGQPFRSDLTLALGAWKRAHWIMPSAVSMGRKVLIDIGIGGQGRERLCGRPRVAVPAVDSHKYRRGLVAVVGGVMPGAALLAAEAAMRGGAGYVKLLRDQSLPPVPAELVFEEPYNEAFERYPNAVFVVGPGLGRDKGARERLAMVTNSTRPAVIDADALHLLDWDALEGVAANRLLLTPHDGELAALCDQFAIAAAGKVDRAAGLRDAIGVNVLAKGPDTILAPADGGMVYFPAGPSWLSTAGTGDVLAGIAASRLAHHGDPALAAEEAVWVHGEAAKIAGAGFTAGELARTVGAALGRFL